MIDDSDNRLLMSESLKGQIPDLEDDNFKSYSEAFVVTSLELSNGTGSKVIIGSLSGISFESLSEIKVDIRISIKEAYDVIKDYTSTGLSARLLYLLLGNDEISIQGPFKIENPKMISFDHQNKMCILGLDLCKL